MTLRPSSLLVYFIAVMLFSVGCAPKTNLEQISREQAATIQSLNNEIARLNDELDEAVLAKGDLELAKMALEDQMKDELSSGEMSVTMDERGLVLTVSNRILFDSGKADLKDSSLESLNKVAAIIGETTKERRIYINGHTDNVPIRHSGWKSNWELSTSRAIEVVHFFSENLEIDPKRLVASGYAEFHPVADNHTEEGKAQNRRVEIVISPKKMQPGFEK